MRLDRKVYDRLRLRDAWRAILAEGLAFLDGIGQEARVQVEPDRRHMPRTARRPGCCRPPGSRGREGDLEAGAELRCVEDRLEALAGLFAHSLAAAVEEIGVRAPAAPPHPAAELVELASPSVSARVDDDRVRVRDVEPGLDDRRADEDVRLRRRRT